MKVKFIPTQILKEFVPYKKTIIEKKAPTDDSIRLYDEIKEKAYNSILKTIRIEDNTISISAILFDDFLTFDKIWKYRFILNGKEYFGQERFSEMEFLKNEEEILRRIIQKVSNQITIEIFGKINQEYIKIRNNYK